MGTTASPGNTLLVYTVDEENAKLRRLMAAGIKGILHKGKGIDELKKALGNIVAGGDYFDDTFTPPHQCVISPAVRR